MSFIAGYLLGLEEGGGGGDGGSSGGGSSAPEWTPAAL